jgi:hypothetical protein
MTSSIGVTTRLPSMRVMTFAPSYVGRRRQHPLHELDELVRLALGLLVVARRELDGGEHEERAEQEEHPDEALDGRRADRDEDAAQDQREHDAEQEHLVLVRRRHREARHDDHEDEQVVDRQRVLRDVAGEELPRVVTAGDHADADAEGDRQRDVEDHPAGGLADRDHVRALAGRDGEVEQEQAHEAADGGEPDPGLDVHAVPPVVRGGLPEVSPARGGPSAPGHSGRADDTLARGYSPPSSRPYPRGRMVRCPVTRGPL